MRPEDGAAAGAPPARVRRALRLARLVAPLRRELVELTEQLWPPRCVLCRARARGGAWCAAHVLPERPPGPRCPACAGPLPPFHADLPGLRCVLCREAPLGLRGALALADYRAQPAARDYVLALKHGGRADLAVPLGRALAERLIASDWAPEAERAEVVVPVPVHAWRRFERGYDQAQRLGRALAEAAGLPFVRALARTRDTPPQGSPWAGSREGNVRGAFRVRPRWASRVSGRRCLLVDDVITSGATVRECARALRRAGARDVVGVFVASAR